MIGRACCRCRQSTDRAAMVLVGVPFANSGPGGPAFYACLPCARIYAASPLAPQWLADDIAARDATAGPQRRPERARVPLTEHEAVELIMMETPPPLEFGPGGAALVVTEETEWVWRAVQQARTESRDV